jgi:hypothetical protein
MKTQSRLLIVTLFVLGMLLAACGGAAQVDVLDETGAAGEESNQVTDYPSLTAYLEASGAKVFETGTVLQPFASIEGKTINVDGGDVQVFEHADLDAVDEEVASILEFLKTSMIMWIEPPHFYQVDKLILIYVGSEAAVIGLLVGLAGPQFAGE